MSASVRRGYLRVVIEPGDLPQALGRVLCAEEVHVHEGSAELLLELDRHPVHRPGALHEVQACPGRLLQGRDRRIAGEGNIDLNAHLPEVPLDKPFLAAEVVLAEEVEFPGLFDRNSVFRA